VEFAPPGDGFSAVFPNYTDREGHGPEDLFVRRDAGGVA
jgi:hypothetical protein